MSFSLLLLLVARSWMPSQKIYAERLELTMPLKTVFAHVKPSPAPPLEYHAVLQPPLRSEYSVCQTRALVRMTPLILEEYSCDVMAYTIFSAPAEAICCACWVATFQPVASQQLMPTLVRLLRSSVGRRTLMKSAAWVPDESIDAYEVLRSGSFKNPR